MVRQTQTGIEAGWITPRPKDWDERFNTGFTDDSQLTAADRRAYKEVATSPTKPRISNEEFDAILAKAEHNRLMHQRAVEKGHAAFQDIIAPPQPEVMQTRRSLREQERQQKKRNLFGKS
ncbi:MAG: hypothetical protein ABIP50_01260 [Candidatus Saccharimonadales bacterium]